MGATLAIACPVNHELDSIHQIQRPVSGIADEASFLVVRNEAHGEGFDLFDKSKVRPGNRRGLTARANSDR